MPLLDWSGKKEVLNHHKEVPFRLLEKDNSKSMENSKNMVIEGDNLEALKSLLPYYKRKIKCIYIDPPYNTGNEGWAYNDNVNSSKMKKWLKKTVGSDDLSRHDKWLCMMYPRLKLLQELISNDGLIFVSINEIEIAHLRLILDEIFGEENYRNCVIIKRGTSNIQAQFETVQKIKNKYESVLIYSKSSNFKLPKPLIKMPEMKIGTWNNHWRSTDRPTLRYELFGKTPTHGTWRWEKSRSMKAIKNYEEMCKKLKDKIGDSESVDRYYLKKINEIKEKNEKFDLLRLSTNNKPEHFVPPHDTELMTDVWMEINANGSRKLKNILPKPNFDNPKTVELLQRILEINTKDDDIILDSFAGSGTTAHAVLDLNKEDGGNRKFILIEMDSKIAKNITSQRIAKVMESYQTAQPSPPPR